MTDPKDVEKRKMKELQRVNERLKGANLESEILKKRSEDKYAEAASLT